MTPKIQHTTVPERAERTWRTGKTRRSRSAKGRTAVPTPVFPSNMIIEGSETTLENMLPSTTTLSYSSLTATASLSSPSRSSSLIIKTHKTLPTSVDIAKERLKVLDAQAKAFEDKGEYYDDMLLRGILDLQPDESVTYDRHLFWDATVQGPVGSPYETATFQIRIVLGKYPTRPPESIIFKTPIYHPAIAYGTNKTLKIHWRDGVAKWNRRFTLLTVVDLVLSTLRNPTNYYTINHKASNMYEESVRTFAMCAGHHASKDAAGHGMSQKALSRFEDNVRLFQLEAELPPDGYLSGVFCQTSNQMNGTEYDKEKRIKIGGHRMILFPGYGKRNVLKNKSLLSSSKSRSSNGLLSLSLTSSIDSNVLGSSLGSVSSQGFSYGSSYGSVSDSMSGSGLLLQNSSKRRPMTSNGNRGGRRFNDGSRWVPGKRQLGALGGFVKAKSTDRHSTPATGIVLLDSPEKLRSSKPRQRPSTAGSTAPVGSFDLRKWMVELSSEEDDEDEETDEDEEDGEESAEDEESEDAETDGEEEEEEESLASLASVRSDATSGIELEDDQEGNARISKLDKTNELFDHGDFEASLEEYRKEIAGKEEDVCHEMGGSGNVVRAMMKAVECYESTMMDLT